MKLLLGVVAVGLGIVAYLWFSAGSGEPTTDLTTPTLPPQTTTTAAGGSDTAPVTSQATEGGSVTFTIDPAQSTARFELDEELRGSPKRVVGTTSEVAGQFRFDPAAVAAAELSPIVVNARTFQTDSSNRDRAIRSAVVLDSGSDEFELITFTPTAIEGLPAAAAVGDTLAFTVTGDLQIKGTSRPVTFEVEVVWSDQDRLEGTAQATVMRSDFGIGIPNAPGVANVSEEVLVALDFIATS